MSSSDDILDTPLSDLGIGNDVTGFDLDSAIESRAPNWHEPGYEGTIDYRIRQLSYSSLLTLHSCPRKFQLYKLRSTHRTEEALKSTITFAFGHIVGEAIQNHFAGIDEEEIIWKMFLGWHTPSLFDRDEKAKKSFWEAVLAVKKFLSARAAGFLSDYELVYYNGKPACELSFAITFPDGFRLRGHVDAVLRSKSTGKIIVLECKTTGSKTLNPATYKNSSQAIGYSVVLDVIYPDLSSYDVLYLIYQTGEGSWNPIPFEKSYLQRAEWIRDLIYDIESIKMYEESGDSYPKRGESCMAFMRECEYLQTCGMTTEYLTRPCTEQEEDKIEYQINLSFMDLINTQERKVALET